MRLALAQINPLVGDLAGNADQILVACGQAAAEQADLVLTPELSLWGYPPRDLLLYQERQELQRHELNRLSKQLQHYYPSLLLLVGMTDPAMDQQHPNLFNAIALIRDGHWNVVAHKQLLPSYDVFDERRYFRVGDDRPYLLELHAGGELHRIGLTICEDLWVEDRLLPERVKGPDPIRSLADQRIDLLVNLSASPFGHRKQSLRRRLCCLAAQKLQCPVIYVNQIGGNDELIFDGAGFVVNAQGHTLLQLPACRGGVQVWDSSLTQAIALNKDSSEDKKAEANELLFRALVLGLRDYVAKCGFHHALLGLSGGIDSALMAIIAAAALGAEHVLGMLMPSPWSSTSSVKDATLLAQRLGIQINIVPIQNLMVAFDAALTPAFGQVPEGITAENLQSRIRGTLLMAVANQQGHLLLSTGNKSELAVGYCTLYGDMNGGLAVLGDVYKTEIFRLCAWLDSKDAIHCRTEFGLPAVGELVGKAIRGKAPSAELRPSQRDSDSLPDYSELDPLLRSMIEERCSDTVLCSDGYDPTQVAQVRHLLQRAEFKRRQAPPLLKVSTQAFGSGWRLPIAAR
ncbi:NAD+ synthase [cyanobiont of Ornithocercus magnificus]|nr:NAD+ synthase [cyanobiont of Ornithocercus magnificus]